MLWICMGVRPTTERLRQAVGATLWTPIVTLSITPYQKREKLNQELVRQGWCWWYRKYAPGDTVLEGLAADAKDSW